MIEILYVWINDYKNIQLQGFHFSNRYTFTFNLSQLDLRIERNPLFIKNFWGNSINNITLLTGENGAGKSNVIHFVKELFSSSLFKKSDEIIVALKVGDEIQIHCYEGISLNLKTSGSLGKECSIHPFSEKVMDEPLRFNIPMALHEVIPEEEIPSIIYFNPNLTEGDRKSDDIALNSQFDISSNLLLQTDIQDGIREEESEIHENLYVTESIPSIVFSSHRQNELKRQLAFICFQQEQENIFEFDFIPKALTIEPRFYQTIEAFGLDKPVDTREFSLPSLDYISSPEQHPDTLKYFSSNGNTNKTDSLRNGIFASLFLSCFHYATFKKNVDSNTEELLLKHLNLFIDTSFNVQHEGELLRLFRQTNVLDEDSIEEIYHIVTGLTAHIEGVQNVGNFDIEITLDTIPYLERLFKLFQAHEVFKIFDFKWRNISSGENAMLNLYSRFYALQKETLLHKNLIIFIEDAEQGFHPLWQKKFISYLIKFLPQIFPKKNLQLIVSSYSPFVISDFSSDNIIFMKRSHDGKGLISTPHNNQTPTLGAPPHLLMLRAFGLENSLCGDFATQKINELIKYLNNESVEMDIRTAQQYINLIGEPILKKQLQKLLDSKRTGEMWDKVDKVYEVQRKMISPKQEIELLKKKLEELEHKLND